MSLTDNIIAYYKLDESSGNAADSVGSNTGTNTDVTYASGKINNAGTFNGSSGKIVLASQPVTGSPVTASFTCWFKTSSATRQGILTFGDSSTSKDCLQLYIYTDYKLHLDFTATGGPNTTGTVNDGNWHFAAISISSGTATLYMDGSSIGTVGSGDLKISTSGTQFKHIGVDPSGTPHYFNGQIDEVGVWSRALSSTEVTALYNSGNGLQYPFSSFTPIIIQF